MASHRESPRQRMIGMMYLVLTALLALNVSKEVINAFSVVNESVLLANETLSRKIRDTFTNFEKSYLLNPEEIGPSWNKANEAHRLSLNLIVYIEKIRDELIRNTEKISLDSVKKTPMMLLQNKDDYTTPTTFMMGSSDNGATGKSGELKKKILEFRKKLLDLVDPRYQSQVKLGLITDGIYYDASGLKQTWEVHNFFEIPMAADIPILNKIITDVYNAELDVVNILYNRIGADDFKYEKVEAKIMPKTNYLFTGDQYEAEVIVAAYDTAQSPKVYYMRGVDSLPVSRKDQATLVTSKNGRIKFNFPATTAGSEKYAGFVSVRNGSGIENTYHFHSEYVVAKPSLSVSATNMNVLYIGVNNPLSIAVAGVPRENIFPSISCGALKPNPIKGGWMAVMTDGCKQATITVSAKVNGVMKPMGTESFRVKKLPDPDPYIGNKKNGFISREMLISAGNIIARMPDDFEFDYQFQIRSFKMTMQRGFNVTHYESQSSRLTDEMIKQIKNTNRGQTIIFEDIIARSPDGADRTLSSLIISIN